MRPLFASALLLILPACFEQPPEIRSTGAMPSEPAPESGSLFVDTFTAGYAQQIDMLFVVDNSGSMGEEIETLRTSFRGFLDVLMQRRTVDFQMAVVNTDAENDEGRLIRSRNGINVVKNTSASMDPVVEMSSILGKVADDVVSGRRVWETGLMASEFAIADHGRAFSRQGVPLAIIYLSDEDDQSCRLDPFKCSEEHYVNYFKSLRRPVLLFPIVGLDTNRCAEVYQNNVFQGGYRYKNVQEKLGTGASHSICLSDVAESFLSVARQISDRGVCYALEHEAMDKPSEVKVEGVEWPEHDSNGWKYDSGTNSVCFGGSFIPEQGSQIHVSYVGH